MASVAGWRAALSVRWKAKRIGQRPELLPASASPLGRESKARCGHQSFFPRFLINVPDCFGAATTFAPAATNAFVKAFSPYVFLIIPPVYPEQRKKDFYFQEKINHGSLVSSSSMRWRYFRSAGSSPSLQSGQWRAPSKFSWNVNSPHERQERHLHSGSSSLQTGHRTMSLSMNGAGLAAGLILIPP